MPIKTDY